MTNRLGCSSVLITGPDLNVSWLVLSPAQFSSVVFYGSDFYGCDCRRGLISCCNLGCTLAFSVELCGVLLAFLALNSQLFHRELDAKRAEGLWFDKYLLWRSSRKKFGIPVTPG